MNNDLHEAAAERWFPQDGLWPVETLRQLVGYDETQMSLALERLHLTPDCEGRVDVGQLIQAALQEQAHEPE